MGWQIGGLAKEAKAERPCAQDGGNHRAQDGKKLDKEAEVVVEYAMSMWKMKMENNDGEAGSHGKNTGRADGRHERLVFHFLFFLFYSKQ